MRDRIAHLEANRRWRARNRERLRAYSREWSRTHRAYMNAWLQRDRAAHPDRYAEYNRRWRHAHPEIFRPIACRHRATRRARIQGGGGSFTRAEWDALVARFDGRCGYCGGPGPLTVDHRVPLARGGASSIDNVIPACDPCNKRKGTRSEAGYRQLMEEATR